MLQNHCKGIYFSPNNQKKTHKKLHPCYIFLIWIGRGMQKSEHSHPVWNVGIHPFGHANDHVKALKNGAYPFKSAQIDPKIGALPFSWGVIWHNCEKNASKSEHCRSFIRTGSAESQRVVDRKRSISVHFLSKNGEASDAESEHCRSLFCLFAIFAPENSNSKAQ